HWRGFQGSARPNALRRVRDGRQDLRELDAPPRGDGGRPARPRRRPDLRLPAPLRAPAVPPAARRRAPTLGFPAASRLSRKDGGEFASPARPEVVRAGTAG